MDHFHCSKSNNGHNRPKSTRFLNRQSARRYLYFTIVQP